MSTRAIDVWTLGETMIRFTPRGLARLEEATELEMRTGGSESNLAIALTRLGLRTAWSSILPDNALGRLTLRRIRGFGVDVSGVVIAADRGRMGTYFIEPGSAPRTGAVLYDRAGSAASTMTPEDFHWEGLSQARHIHLTGITPALGPGAAATVRTALDRARDAGCTASFDINYRARLWSTDRARQVLSPLIADVDLLISPIQDVIAVFGAPEDPDAAVRHLAGLTTARSVVLTLGGGGALLWDGRESVRAEPFPVTAVDRVGAGDAFDAGLIWGYLRGDIRAGLQYGMAMAAYKHSILGDEFVATLDEVEALLRAGHRDIQR